MAIEDEDRIDPELPDETDMDDGEDTMPCPHCGQAIDDLAEHCPHCGNYLSEEESSASQPFWIILTVVVCVLIILVLWLR